MKIPSTALSSSFTLLVLSHVSTMSAMTPESILAGNNRVNQQTMAVMQHSDNLARRIISFVNGKLPDRRAKAESAVHHPAEDPLRKPTIKTVPALENILSLSHEYVSLDIYNLAQKHVVTVMPGKSTPSIASARGTSTTSPQRPSSPVLPPYKSVTSSRVT